jgi:hypothetical protein
MSLQLYLHPSVPNGLEILTRHSNLEHRSVVDAAAAALPGPGAYESHQFDTISRRTSRYPSLLGSSMALSPPSLPSAKSAISIGKYCLCTSVAQCAYCRGDAKFVSKPPSSPAQRCTNANRSHDLAVVCDAPAVAQISEILTSICSLIYMYLLNTPSY